MALGRNALGIDISSLACFVCDSKTAFLTDEDVTVFQKWAASLSNVINMHTPSTRFHDYANSGYYRNLEDRRLWRHRKAIEQCLFSLNKVSSERALTLARCVILRTAQWAIDTRKTFPSIANFRKKLEQFSISMLDSAIAFRRQLKQFKGTSVPKVMCLNRSAVGLEEEEAVKEVCPPKLIVTSPPYSRYSCSLSSLAGKWRSRITSTVLGSPTSLMALDLRSIRWEIEITLG